MQVNIQKINKLKHKLEIGISGKEYITKKDDFYSQASKNLKVPGFRPGKAPIDLLKKHHGEALKQKFIEKYIPIFYQQAIQENKILPAGLPKISDLQVTEENISFSAELEVQPQISINEDIYKGIKIKDQEVKPDQKIITETIKKFKEETKKITSYDLNEQKLAKWASYSNMDSFREAIAVQIHLDNLQKRRQNIENQIRTHLINSIKPEVPAAETEQYQKQLLSQQTQQLMRQGIKQEDIDKYTQDLEKKIKPIAENEVKFYYILRAIAKKEKIKEDGQMANTVIGLILSEAVFESNEAQT